ncbi:MAG TPA: Fic family protein [Spirochaetia bacterium]|nr:Fic family protein [Spirochaetia bacterium]
MNKEVIYMSEKNISIWKPIEFKETWLETNTSSFDELADSWFEKRKDFNEGNKEYHDFLNKLKRQHAIETGIIEKLYNLSEGITQTLIKEGFVESFISHDDTNIPANQLIGYLNSHFEAMDFVFDMVKNNRPLTKSFILELHQLILKHQDYTVGINSLEETVKIKLLKGKFKERPNNPRRDDGTIYEYCSPIHVESEIDNLIKIYNEIEKKEIHPLVIAGWFHHAFTQIHPFQDGNGRIARLLTSLILIKYQLFPLNILRNEKSIYINALEKADSGFPNDLIKFFSNIQRRNIESALNIQKQPESLKEVASIFKEKVESLTKKQKIEREKIITLNRNLLFKEVYKIIGELQSELFLTIPQEKAYIKAISKKPSDKEYFYYTNEIIEYANNQNYFFNKNLPRGWSRLSFFISKEKRYDIVISIHHFGYFDSVVAIGSFIEFIDKSYNRSNIIEQSIPLNVKHYTLSLEKEITERTKENLKDYFSDIIKVGLSIIINELS